MNRSTLQSRVIFDRNGIHLAEGVDLQKMSSAITKNENSINGLMESVGD